MPRKSIGLAVSVVLAAALAACATPTPYQPYAKSSKTSGGFTELQLEPNRYRVTFAGNSLTSRETVEGYLLYRAAELTVQRGYDWFSVVDRATDRKTNTYVDTWGPWYGGYYGWRPYWRYYGYGYGWHTWDPYWGSPFWGNTVDVRTVDRYEAAAEIVMEKGAKPQGDVSAFDARAVMSSLGPRIQYPEPKS